VKSPPLVEDPATAMAGMAEGKGRGQGSFWHNGVNDLSMGGKNHGKVSFALGSRSNKNTY
jgi:hypothetical protein